MARSNFIVRGGADFSGIKKELTKTQAQLQGFQAKVSSIMKGIGTVLGSLAVGKLIKDSTKAAMSVESAMDNIGRNMGNAASAFQNWVDTQSKALGMAKADAYSYGSVFSNLLSSFTSGAQETADQTQALMKAAAIIASKTGRTYEDVANRIRSGMLGSTEAIEDLGVYVNVSMLEATDAFKKFAGNKSWSQLTFQQQQQIRLSAILEQTYKRYGDTLADTTQTRQAQFLASLQNIKLTLGQAFLPIYNAVLPALTAMADAINRVVSVFAQFTQALFGKAATTQAKATQQQATAVTELGDATEEAAKKAKKNLQTFDEVHQLQEEMSDTSAGGISTTDTAAVDPLELEDAGEPEAFSKFQEVLEKLAVLFGPVADGFNKLKEAAEPIVKNIGEGLKWLWNEVLVPFGSWAISEAVPAFFNLLSGAFTVLNPLIEGFKPLGQWLWDNFLVPVASWTGEAFVTAINAVGNALKAIGDWMSENKPVVEGIAIAFAAFFAAWKLTELMAFIQMSGGIVAAIQAITSAIWSNIAAKIADKAETIAIIALYAKDFIVTLAKGVASLATNTAAWIANTAAMVAAKAAQIAVTVATTAWSTISGIATAATTALGVAFNFLISPITLIIAAIAAVIAIVVLLIKHWDEVSAAAVSAWEWIKSTWQVVAEWFNTNIIQPLVNFFTELWANIKQLASDTWSGIVEIWQVVSGWFNTNVIQPVINFFTELWTNIKQMAIDTWNNIVEIWQTVSEWFYVNVIQPVAKFFAGLWDGIKEAASNAWDGIVEAWNDAASWFDTNIIQPIAQFFIDLWEGIKEVWNKAAGWFDSHVIQPIVNVFNGLKTKIIGIWEGIWSGIKSVVNSIIDGINILIRGLNKIHFDIPDWVPLIGGKSFGINIPLIPKLNTGTNYVPQDMLAYLHEGEAVVPKKYNPAAAGLNAETIEQAVYRAFTNALRIMQASARQDDKELVLKIDNTVLARMQLPAIIREGQRQGLNLVVQPQGV